MVVKEIALGELAPTLVNILKIFVNVINILHLDFT
jgi:hypothetical protein